MQVINQKIISGKRVLLRYDIDVALRLVFDPEAQTRRAPLAQGKLVVAEDYKLRAGIPTLKLCIQNASKVVILGHIGRPSFAGSASVATSAKEAATEGKPDKFFVPKYSVAPVVEWFKAQGYRDQIDNGKLTILENLRFDPRESFDEVYPESSRGAQDKESIMEYAQELASMGDVYINEAFSSYRPAVSTTVLPTLFPYVKDPEGHLWPRRAVGLRFAMEVKKLIQVRENPKKPFIAIMGGAKVKDKLPVIEVLAQIADAVLVGGKLVAEIREQNLTLPKNVMVGKLNEDGFDIAEETVSVWAGLIGKAGMIVWNGPLGKFEEEKYAATQKVAQMILESRAEIVIGGGDSVAALTQYGMLEKAQQKAFVSVGGGAMLKFLADGTLPTIEALEE